MKTISAKKIIRILEKIGFQKIRQKGSHVVMRHPDGRMSVIPVHKGEDIGPGLLLEIIKDTKLSKNEFFKKFPCYWRPNKICYSMPLWGEVIPQ
jgi:predicted RNA binding protein YcfA (HicA-like mRNA interferase family)